MELGTEPMPFVRTKDVALSKLGNIQVTRDNLADATVDGGEKFRRRFVVVTGRVFCGESLQVVHEPGELLME
jgi:hypothetical protein